MKSRWTLNAYQFGCVLLYAVLFPVLNTAGGSLASFGLLLAAPFLPLAYVAGALGMSLLGGDVGYVAGATVGIALQAWLVAVVLISIFRRIRA
jgi:hypothetical protein